MTIKHRLGDQTIIKPGVYSNYSVVNSMQNLTPSPRNILIVGESDEGPSYENEDLSTNFFSSLNDVRSKYGKGPLVDACVQLLTTQPDRIFTGSTGRIYIAKTNKSDAASRFITDFGSVQSSRYGEIGNYIKSQVKLESTEILPETVVSLLGAPVNQDLNIAGNGVKELELSYNINDIATLVTSINNSDMFLATGENRTLFAVDNIVNIIANNDTITVEGSLDTLPRVNDTIFISKDSSFKGAGNSNIGSYLVVSVGTSSFTAKKIRNFNDSNEEISYTAPEDVGSTSYVNNDIICASQLHIKVIKPNVDGASSTLEMSDDGRIITALNIINPTFSSIISSSVANIASVRADYNSSLEELMVTLIDGTFGRIVQKGTLVEIRENSVLAGSSQQNVGIYHVVKSSVSNIILKRLDSVTTGVDIVQTYLAGENDFASIISNSVSTDEQSVIHNSSQEESISFNMENTLEGTTFRSGVIGGKTLLSISYYNSTVSSAKISIDQKRRLILTVDGVETANIQTSRFNSIARLAEFLETIEGVKTHVHREFSAHNPSILDQVQDLNVLALSSSHKGGVAPIKNDYNSFRETILRSGLKIASETLVMKNKLPVKDDNHVYFREGGNGGTSNNDIQKVLEDCINLPVRMVIPLFSRDAVIDVDDMVTSAESTYDIDAINQLVSAHVSTASNFANQKERIALISYYGEIEDTKIHVNSINNYLCSGVTFQQIKTIDSEGELKWHLPYIAQCMIAAGRAQSLLGIPMLYKAFNMSDIRHIGNESLYSDTFKQSFDYKKLSEVEDAIKAGLIVFGDVAGKSGIVHISPDLSSVSNINDPKSYFYERHNLIFINHELLQTCRSVLNSFIGPRRTDVDSSTIRSALDSTLSSIFLSNGSIRDYRIDSIEDLGNGYRVELSYQPTEAIEFIGISVSVTREM